MSTLTTDLTKIISSPLWSQDCSVAPTVNHDFIGEIQIKIYFKHTVIPVFRAPAILSSASALLYMVLIKN